MSKKVILIGVDSLLPEFVEKFVAEGKLPNIASMMQSGCYTRALPVLPALTSTNWATIATGADAEMHGVSCFFGHTLGEPLDQLTNAFTSSFCRAEQIWQTAERYGKRSIVIDFPGSFPLNFHSGIHIGEYGCPSRSERQICFSMCYSTKNYPKAQQVRLTPASGWSNIPRSIRSPLECQLTIQPFDWDIGWPWAVPEPKPGSKAETFHVLVTAEQYDYDTVVICDGKDAAKPLCRLQVGQWSKWLTHTFSLATGDVSAAFRVKLLNLSPDGRELKIYISQVYPTEGFTYPPSLAEQLNKACGPYLPHSFSKDPYVYGWIDLQTFKEETEYSAEWTTRCLEYMIDNENFDLMLTKWHSPDHVKHAFWGGIDPISPAYDPAKEREAWEIFVWNYQLVDQMVGRILKRASNDTVVMLVSDHGHIAHVKSVMINDALADAGLLAFGPDGKVNWKETKAYAQRLMYVYVNTKGVCPDGIVGPNEYHDVCQKVINVLLDLKDPETGVHPVNFALNREDARALGLGGDRVGDVIYGMTPGYAGIDNRERLGKVFPSSNEVKAVWGWSHHGQNLGNAKLSIGSINAVWVLKGPGIRHNYRSRNLVSLKDVAPTVAHILGIDAPRHAQGRVIKDFLESS